ncbi:hypothetical protein [Rhizobium sp. LCM 4573]|uniref:hypothetical protein n=1 Tax=Rhizobium sp. LCM 4573 TaxID=1848291 RepID=UPI0008D9AC8B|nr:hypothetical protein [Rhizobium sp. LCM 4573]OHV81515.1 hypothetical protein LCM4573_20700 [Rhizobium sp. LCM 4573]
MTGGMKTAAKLLRILCAAVLLSLGFAHQPVIAAAPLASYDEAYRLPDGTFAEICTEGGHRELPAAKPVCEACLLAGSIILPPPSDEAWLARKQASLFSPLTGEAPILGGRSLIRPNSRAPPPAA